MVGGIEPVPFTSLWHRLLNRRHHQSSSAAATWREVLLFVIWCSDGHRLKWCDILVCRAKETCCACSRASMTHPCEHLSLAVYYVCVEALLAENGNLMNMECHGKALIICPTLKPQSLPPIILSLQFHSFCVTCCSESGDMNTAACKPVTKDENKLKKNVVQSANHAYHFQVFKMVFISRSECYVRKLRKVCPCFIHVVKCW